MGINLESPVNAERPQLGLEPGTLLRGGAVEPRHRCLCLKKKDEFTEYYDELKSS